MLFRGITLLDQSAIDSYIKAGEAVKLAKRRAKDVVRRGVGLRTVCEEVEKTVLNLGCKPSFPCNICVNEIAAHYTPKEKTKITIPDNSLVKVDVGAHHNGFIADSAITVNVSSEYEELLQAVNEALDNVVKEIKPNIKVSKISSIIEKTIKYYGFKPISNLAGHQLNKYVLHTGFIIPNVKSLRDLFTKLTPGNVYAIEPFATLKEGAGKVEARRGGNIFRLVSSRPPKMGAARSLFLEIQRRYKTLPFTPRWLTDLKKNPKYPKAFNSLMEKGYVSEYPYLVEGNKQPVAQSEHTFLILEKEVITIT